MGAADVVIASNRGPIGFRRDAAGVITASRGGGGLVSGMAGLSADGMALWVCAALGEIDREVAAAAPGGRIDLAGYDTGGAVRMLPIAPETFASAYNVISNTTLWYLHHGLTDETTPHRYDADWRRDWASYVECNQTFAEAIATDAATGARVLVQDYHLSLLPAMLRAQRPDLRIGHFSHTPWAEPADFTTLPADIAVDLLVGMLGADSAGFHSPRWARNFIECCDTVLDVATSADSVVRDGHTTHVRVHPLGVDAAPLLARAAEPDVVSRRTALEDELGSRRAIVRVDRTEPSKNIVRGLAAFRDLLVRFPEHREQVVHVALAYPSRQDVADYVRYTAAIEALAAEINAELATASWTPVRLTIRDDYAQSLATLQVGDVLLINPVRDGMNLVAKEAALLTDDAVLVLSRLAGAADEMAQSALLVDPFDVEATADALHEALTMPARERAERHRGLVRAATALPPQQWLREQLDALTQPR